MEEGRVLPLHR